MELKLVGKPEHRSSCGCWFGTRVGPAQTPAQPLVKNGPVLAPRKSIRKKLTQSRIKRLLETEISWRWPGCCGSCGKGIPLEAWRWRHPTSCWGRAGGSERTRTPLGTFGYLWAPLGTFGHRGARPKASPKRLLGPQPCSSAPPLLSPRIRGDAKRGARSFLGLDKRRRLTGRVIPRVISAGSPCPPCLPCARRESCLEAHLEAGGLRVCLQVCSQNLRSGALSPFFPSPLNPRQISQATGASPGLISSPFQQARPGDLLKTGPRRSEAAPRWLSGSAGGCQAGRGRAGEC